MVLTSFRKAQRAVAQLSTWGLAALWLAISATPAHAGEAEIRKALAERLADLGKVDEVTKSPIPGLYEVRVGVEIYYTDENGNYLIEGQLLDTKTRTNLTEARIAKLTAIDFASLPLKDAVVWKQGDGSRKLVVFADPNCGYCKRFEREARAVKDITIYTFLYPVLGAESADKSRNVWCAKDRGKVWTDWMVDSVPPPKATAECDSGALQRNAALGRKHKINGTPALVFEDGKRVPGAMSLEQLEKQLLASAKKPG